MIYIVVRAKNGHELVRSCIHSITENTADTEYRLILVDDGSQPKLDDVADILIRNDRCNGAVTATNQGVAVALADPACEYVLILDNDTLIPEGDTGWLERMVGELEEGGPKCAAVGATTNFANPPQHILTSPPTYARNWNDERTKREGSRDNPPIPCFVSFAVLLRASVLREVGPWDERYNPGNYEDTDYSVQLRSRGYELRVARSVYIHHVGHQTFKEELPALLEANAEKFYEKWGVGRLFDLGMVQAEQLKAVL